MNVSYLGPEGSFTQIALIDYFGSEAKHVSERTIDDVFLSVQQQKVEYGIVPIENSFEGSVNNTHDLLIGSKLKIYDEVEIRIKQCLISRTSEITNINKIYSHPQSFAQCRKWLKDNLPEAELIPVLSNSEGAQKILSNNETLLLAFFSCCL
jgi:chorismate mutase/prephenate dehydratase